MTMIEKPCKITSAFLGKEDHGIETFTLQCDFPNSYTQGFGGWRLDDHGVIWNTLVTDMCAVVGVKDWSEIEGKDMLALYDITNLPGPPWRHQGTRSVTSDFIKGLKNPRTGAVFLIDNWAAKVQVLDRMVGNK